jgi:hypothetical protein
MILRTFTEPIDSQWQEWRKKADAATKELITRATLAGAITHADIKEDLYKGGRDVLWKIFHGKCVYCEAKFVLDQSGDVEHFRPKLGVKDENDAPVAHPGYYWLVYDWHNLLPSCAKCNRLTRTDTGLIGKGERFPVAGKRASQPGEEALEEALLLNPVLDNPEEHLLLDARTGILAGKTPRGTMTEKLLGLNREGLPEERKKVYTSVRGIISDIFAALKNDNLANALESLDLVDRYRRGEEAYSWAGRKALADDATKLEPLVGYLSKLAAKPNP